MLYNKFPPLHLPCCLTPMRVGCNFYEPAINGCSRMILNSIVWLHHVCCWVDRRHMRESILRRVHRHKPITFCNLCVAMHDICLVLFWQAIGNQKPNHGIGATPVVQCANFSGNLYHTLGPEFPKNDFGIFGLLALHLNVWRLPKKTHCSDKKHFFFFCDH